MCIENLPKLHTISERYVFWIKLSFIITKINDLNKIMEKINIKHEINGENERQTLFKRFYWVEIN